jgi:hypothetical protein
VETVCRKSSDSDAWHFCVNCSDWPTANYTEHWVQEIRAVSICIECEKKRHERRCRMCDPRTLYGLTSNDATGKYRFAQFLITHYVALFREVILERDGLLY